MRALLFLFALCALFLFTGCKSNKGLARAETIRDTVERTVTIVERDTILQAPAAEATVSAPLKDLLNGAPMALKSRDKQASVTLTSDGKTLKAECKCDTLAIEAKLRDRVEQERRATLATITETVPKRFTPWWVVGLAAFGGVFLLLTGVLFAARKVPALN